jgi:alpha-beta hydrolase superfamily lysophospholipase
LLVRGVLTVFSLGLDDLAQELQQQDLDVQVVPAALATPAVERMARQYADGELDGPLVLIGHSLGGDLLPRLAQRLAAYGLTVDLMVMIDSTHPSDSPENVLRCVNLYQSNPSPAWFRGLHGAPIRATNPATQLANIDIRQLPEQDEAAGLNHFNIEASRWIHRMVVREVLRVVQAPPAEPAEGVTIQVTDLPEPESPPTAVQAASAGASGGPHVDEVSISSR